MKKLYLALFFVLAVCGLAEAANYPLEIIQPRAGLTAGPNATNRFYKAYPGIEYNVKVAVIGGDYPFTFTLVTAPSGMNIDPSTGVISWPNPQPTSQTLGVNCGGATGCTITARVTDFSNFSTQVSWSITVTTTKFMFIDSVNGTQSNCNNGGPNPSNGTISQPFRTIADWFCGTDVSAKHTTTFNGYFVYYRAGTYVNNSYHESNTGQALVWNTNEKPAVHMCYPGETCNLDMTGSFWYMDVVSTNAYFDGFTVINMTQHRGFGLENGSNVTFRRINCPVMTNSTGSNNQSCIFIDATNANPTVNSHYWTVTESTFSSFSHAYAILIYFVDRVLIADNTMDGFTDPAGQSVPIIGFKAAVNRGEARNNTISNSGSSTEGIGSLYADSTSTAVTGNLEIRFNNIGNSANCIYINEGDYGPRGGPVYIYRNTCYGGGGLNIGYVGTNGPFYLSNNVIQNAVTSPATHISCPNSGTTGNACPTSRVTITNNLVGTTGLVDSSGYLVNAANIGTYGFQLSGTAPPTLTPKPPSALTLTP